MIKTKECTRGHGPGVGSPHPRKSVPIELFLKNPTDPKSPEFKTCWHCREYARSVKEKSVSESNMQYEAARLAVINGQSQVMVCLSKLHNTASPYQNGSVPIHLMSSIENDGSTTIYRMCKHCREFANARKKDRKHKIEEKFTVASLNIHNGSTVGYCTGDSHNAVSTHPRDIVPVELLKQYPNNPDSPILKVCIDCREDKTSKERSRINKKRIESTSVGKKLCSTCNICVLEGVNLCFNKDGTESKTCKGCREIMRTKNRKLKSIYKTIIYERILENGHSCMKCEKLFMKAPDGSIIVSQVNTYVKTDGIRYFMYQNIEYPALKVISSLKPFLELDLIEMDHLSEQEQRELGILRSTDEYLPKHKDVSSMRSETSMRLEAKKCQHLCVLCHYEMTMFRTRRTLEIEMSSLRRDKFAYVNSIKLMGCNSCGVIHEDTGKMDMDHLDPTKKTEGLATMVADSKYTLQNVIDECFKCQVLCKFCHKMRTRQQHLNGEIRKSRCNSDNIA